jgi:hypothetical protein
MTGKDRTRRLQAAVASAWQAPLFEGARLSVAELLDREAQAHLCGGDAPPADGGLFDDAARRQPDLFSR